MSTIIEQLETSVSARKDSLIALRARIEKLLVPIPVGVILSDDAGELCRVLRICTGASQWSNRTWRHRAVHGGVRSGADGKRCRQRLKTKARGTTRGLVKGKQTPASV
jgi:hypothetical protein